MFDVDIRVECGERVIVRNCNSGPDNFGGWRRERALLTYLLKAFSCFHLLTYGEISTLKNSNCFVRLIIFHVLSLYNNGVVVHYN